MNSLMSASGSFEYLLSLVSRRGSELNVLPSARDNVTESWSGIGFRLGEHFCVTAMADVAEVLTEPSATRLPGVKAWVRGVANVRGRLLPLVDLTLFLNEQVSTVQRQRRVLVIEKGDIYLGLIVDEVFGLQHFDVGNYRREGGLKDSHLQAYIQGGYQQDERFWAVFRPAQLIEDKNFYTVAA
jgi:twitching motility protein PilI